MSAMVTGITAWESSGIVTCLFAAGKEVAQPDVLVSFWSMLVHERRQGGGLVLAAAVTDVACSNM